MGSQDGVALDRRVHDAIADREVGTDDLFAPLTALDAVSVTVDRATATVTVSLPVPAEAIRDRLAREIRAAASSVDPIERVEVTWQADAADPGSQVEILPEVKNVVAISSGKGGVGKSTVAANLAVALADAGASVGLLDADIYGPNAPTLLGLDKRTPSTTADATIVPREAHGVKVISMDFIVGEDDPVIWRGPMVDDVIKQLTGDVEWGDLDYLLVDMPPGTGDAQMTLVQYLPVTGAVVVTTPQPVAVDDARRGLEGFVKYDVPILGIVENMSRFECPDCHHTHEIFGEGGANSLAAEFDLPVLGALPLDPAVGALVDTADETGITLPIVGRVGLPRTTDERDPRLDPVAIRDDGAPRTAFREIATRTAARVNAVPTIDDVD
jgi:ATP-binding protein involved in chromosome partitioning